MSFFKGMDFRDGLKVVRAEMRARGIMESLNDPCPDANRNIIKRTENTDEPHSILYLTQSTELFKIKVGITTTHQKTRFTSLKSSSPSRLKLLGIVPHASRQQALDMETILKNDMRRWNSHNEWFNESESVWNILSEFEWEENPYTDSINDFLCKVISDVPPMLNQH